MTDHQIQRTYYTRCCNCLLYSTSINIFYHDHRHVTLINLQLTFKSSEKRKRSVSGHSTSQDSFLSLGVLTSTLPRKLMSCEAPDWIDLPHFCLLRQNDEFGCTLMRCKADWLEIWTPNHGPNQSQTFPSSSDNIKV